MGLARAAILGAGANWAGAVAGFLARFALTAVLARLIDPAVFGKFALALVYSELLSVIISATFAQAIVQFENDVELIIAATIQLNAGVCALLLLVAIVLFPITTRSDGPDVAALVIGLAFARAVVIIAGTYDALLQRELRFTLMAALRVVGIVLSMIFALVLAMTGYPLLALLARESLWVLPSAWGLFTKVPINWGLVLRGSPPLREMRRKVFALGTSIFWVRAIEIAYSRLDQLLLGKLLGVSELAFYAQARYVSGLPNAAVGQATTSVMLRVLSSVSNQPVRFRRASELLQLALAHLLTPCALVMALAPKVLIRTAFGERWTPAAEVLPWLAGCVVLIPLGVNMQTGLMSMGLWQPLRRSQFAQLIALLVASFVLVPLVGPPGAALAITITGLLNVALMHYATPSEYRIRLSTYRGVLVGTLVASVLVHLLRVRMTDELATAAAGLLGYALSATLADWRNLRDVSQFIVRNVAPTSAPPSK